MCSGYAQRKSWRAEPCHVSAQTCAEYRDGKLKFSGDEKSLDIEVFLNDSSSKYKIIGNDNLENNSVIRIEVLAQDGSIRVYKIKISKEMKNQKDYYARMLNLLTETIVIKIKRANQNKVQKEEDKTINYKEKY